MTEPETDTEFDVVVVGGRCAGASVATFLARAGVRVCVLDQARFPSDMASTHGIQPSGVRVLERLGAAEALRGVAASIEHGTLVLDDDRIEFTDVSARLGAPMMNVRRVTLDAMLLDGARAAGAQVRTRTPVTGLLVERGRVVGVVTRSGEVRASLVVGADGARSTVTALVGARKYHRTPPGRMFVWGYFDGVAAERDRLWMGKIGDHAFLASPTDSDLFMAAVAPSIGRLPEILADAAAGHADGMRHWPELRDCLAGADRVGPLRVMHRWEGFFRESAGPGWVLVGDAGHVKDPTPGQGISDALRQAATLSEAIQRALDAGGDQDQVLRDWWSRRDRDAWPMYWFARDMGAPGPTPLLVRHIQRRIAADPRLTDGLLRVLDHERDPSTLFTARLALRSAAEALAAHPGRRAAVLREALTLSGEDVRRRTRSRRRRRRSPARPRATVSVTPEVADLPAHSEAGPR